MYYYRQANGTVVISDKPIKTAKPQRLISVDGSSEIGKLLQQRKQSDKNFSLLISTASQTHAIDANLVKAVIRVESGFNPNAVSRKGAKGLMQLMDTTAQQYALHNSFDPTENIYAGTEHLKYLLQRYDNNLDFALAAYNAGPSAVDRYGGIPPYRETQSYVRKVKLFQARYALEATP